MAKLTYHITHEARDGRCVWCWEELPASDSHTAFRWFGIELRFHHGCWPQYRACCGLEQKAPDPWTPQRIEELRIRGGWNMLDFASRLQAKPERLRRLLTGDQSAMTPTLMRNLRTLANLVRFEKLPKIDWADPRAFFCLCRHLNWSLVEASRSVGVAYSTAKRWLDDGVPPSTPSAWAVLTRLAEKHGFDSGAVVDDRAWTAELLAQAIESSGEPVSTWARLAQMSDHMVHNCRKGKNQITRSTAWGLTRAASTLGVPLPPVGLVGYVRPPQRRHRPTQRKKRWTPDMDAMLGTAPDSAVAAQLNMTTVAVAKRRLSLGIQAFTKRSARDKT